MSTCRRMILLVVLLMLGHSCSTSSQPANEAPTVMTFSVVEALLGAPVQLPGQGLSLRPPKEWLPLDSLRVAELAPALTAHEDSTFRLTAERVFLDPANGCALFVCSWRADSGRTWKDVEAWQRAHLPAGDAGRSVKHDAFILAEQPCLQSLIQDSARVNFKLLLSCGIQLDYLVPRHIYESQVELIESSLGSVTLQSVTTQP